MFVLIMKLGEAKFRLKQLQLLLMSNEQQLVLGPKENISQVLESCNSILTEQTQLRKRVEETEATLAVGTNSLAEINSALETVSDKIKILECLIIRKDFGEEEKISIEKQLNNYRSTRDTLMNSINQCLWDITLLVE